MSKTSKSSHGFLYLILAALAVVVVVIWIWWPKEDPEEYRRFQTSEARANSWLALSMFLERHNVSVHRETPFGGDSVPSHSDTVFITDGPLTIATEKQSQDLENWVRGGGTLFYAAKYVMTEERTMGNSQQLFPMKLNIYRERLPGGFLLGSSLKQFGDCREKTTEIELSEGASATMQSTSSRIPARFDLTRVAEELQYEVMGKDLMLRIPYGQGEVYVLTDLDRWKNVLVACYDHAFVLYSIVSDSTTIGSLATGRNLWILPLSSIPPLPLLIWNRYPFAVVGCALAFVIMLIIWNIRLSPPMYEIPRPRRSAFDYASSAAKFAWRSRHMGPYLKALCTYAVQNSSDTDTERHVRQAAKLRGVDIESVRSALNLTSSSTNEKSLVERVRLVQAVYKCKEAPSSGRPN